MNPRQAANLATAAAQIALPLLAPRGVDEVTERLPRTPVRPVGPAFAIWGPIFAASAAYAGYQALPAVGGRRLHREIGWLTAAAFAGDGLWMIVVPRRRVDAGAGLVVGTAAAATVAYARLDAADRRGELTGADRWLAGSTVGALAGWTTVASAISTADTLARHGVVRSERARSAVGGGLVAGASAWGAALTLRGRGLRRPHAAAYAAAVAWGLGGIAAKLAYSHG